nr:MAG TPA_asm: hypothetical protein [Caudoviricetes sp.]
MSCCIICNNQCALSGEASGAATAAPYYFKERLL